jgi:RNA polymerase-binding protein DksA
MASATVPTLTGLAKLEQQRQELLAELERLRMELLSLAEPSADEADLDAYEREKTWALIQSVQRKLESVEHTIELAQNGSYGICQNCGDRIDPARLEILPDAKLCLNCQRVVERKARRRPGAMF